MSWTVEPAHTSVGFSLRHMMISTVRGTFDKSEITLDLNPDDMTQTKVEVKVEMNSINTRDDRRDGHLRSPDFFNVEQYPYMTFQSTKIEAVGPNHYKMTGNLTIRDATKPVTFDVQSMGPQVNPWGAKVMGFSATATINRNDWGLNWNMALEAGGVVVSEHVKIELDLEAAETAAVPAEPATA